MDEFNELVAVVDQLLGENGCPWDRKQTMKTIRSDLLEEASELIEAIDHEDNSHIEEELGDLFFIFIFLARLAEKEERTTMQKVLLAIKEKLIRRHPHVFGDEELETTDDLLKRWEEIKQTEKGKESRTSVLDGIPKGLPALARAQKVLKKMEKAKFTGLPVPLKNLNFETENELGELILSLAREANARGLDAEHALKSHLSIWEKKFRD